MEKGILRSSVPREGRAGFGWEHFHCPVETENKAYTTWVQGRAPPHLGLTIAVTVPSTLDMLNKCL